MKISISNVLLVTCLVALLGGPVEGLQAKAGASDAEAASAGISRVIARMWWNQPQKISALELSDDQRKLMDAKGMAALIARKSSTKKQSDAFSDFSESLQQGDWEAALKKADTLAQEAGSPVRLQAEMMVDVLRLLSAEQLQKLEAEFPLLLTSPWMRSGSSAVRKGQRQREQ